MAAKAGEFLDEKGDDPRDDWGGNAGARKPHVRLRVPQIRNVVPLAREVKQRLPRGGDRRVVEKLPVLADRAGRVQTCEDKEESTAPTDMAFMAWAGLHILGLVSSFP